MLKRLLRRIARPPRAHDGSGSCDSGTQAGIIQLDLGKPRPWTGGYPDLPPPQSDLNLQLFVARFVCGDIYGEETPAIAADLLEAGFDTPSLRRLAGETQVRCHADAAGLMEQVTREAGFPVPFPLNNARMLVTRQIARKVIAGEREIWAAVTDLNGVWGWRSRADTDQKDLKVILRSADEFVWAPEEQRFRPVVDADLLEAFARLANMSDGECASTAGTLS